MLNYPKIDPVAIQLGPLAVRWYSLAYIIGILGGWWYAGRMNKRARFMSHLQFDAILSWIVVGIVLGGRVGYVLFYKPGYYFEHPLEIFYLWQGGMSFHGGMTGTILAIYIFCRIHKLAFFKVMDIAACVSPIGLFLGRLANFVNGELYGRPTDSAIAMIFPNSDGQPRYPSQLIEASLEGVCLFIILSVLFWKFNKWQRPMFLSGVFLICYGTFRIIGECFREPDVQLGYLFQHLTMGQILSTPMILLGGYLVVKSKRLYNNYINEAPAVNN